VARDGAGDEGVEGAWDGDAAAVHGGAEAGGRGGGGSGHGEG
jgi:hypothetical protein